jgi:hypothetical protein
VSRTVLREDRTGLCGAARTLTGFGLKKVARLKDAFERLFRTGTAGNVLRVPAAAAPCLRLCLLLRPLQPMHTLSRRCLTEAWSAAARAAWTISGTSNSNSTPPGPLLIRRAAMRHPSAGAKRRRTHCKTSSSTRVPRWPLKTRSRSRPITRTKTSCLRCAQAAAGPRRAAEVLWKGGMVWGFTIYWLQVLQYCTSSRITKGRRSGLGRQKLTVTHFAPPLARTSPTSLLYYRRHSLQYRLIDRQVHEFLQSRRLVDV